MSSHQAVLDLTHAYLRAVYEGDVAALKEVFHEGARVEDTATGAFRSRSAAEYIQAVGSRQSPKAAGEAFTMAPLSIEVHGDSASVTADLRFLGNHYVNILAMAIVEGRWRIVHKLFSAVA